MATKVLFFCGSDNPESAFPPFMLGLGAVATDMEVSMFFTMSGLNIILKGGAEKIKLEGAPKTLPELVKLAQESGIRMIACSAAFKIACCTEADLIEGVEIGGIAGFLTDAEKADILLTF